MPALGRQILFDGSHDAKTVRNTMMPDRLMKPLVRKGAKGIVRNRDLADDWYQALLSFFYTDEDPA